MMFLINLSDDMFAMQLSYNGETTELGNTARYNGDISAMVWAVNYDNVQGMDTKQKAYAFNYDNVNRLNSANYLEEQSGTLTDVNPFDLVNVSYDKNGNITALTRKGSDGNTIDDLAYTYKGNILQSVEDGATNKTQGFPDNASLTTEMQYDVNGNLTSDENKDILSISYNHLNLPEQVIVNTDTIDYIYDAAGNKWAELFGGSQATEKYYMGSFEYENSSLGYIHNAYGRVRKESSAYHYDYFLSDHLGNVRVVFTDDGTGGAELLQASSYYPFGMQFGQGPEYEAEQNKYLYNGKQLQEYANLNMHDYGWRQYDAALGRWHVQDQLAEKYFSLTPYNYVAGNPTNYIDPDGRDMSPSEAWYAATVACLAHPELDFFDTYTAYKTVSFDNSSSSGGGSGVPKVKKLYEYQGISGAWVLQIGDYIFYPQGYYYKDADGNTHTTITKYNKGENVSVKSEGDPTKEEQLHELYINDPRASAPMFSKERYEWHKDVSKVEGTYGLWNKILFSEPARYNCIFWDKTFDIIQSIGSFPTSPYDVVRDQTMNNPDLTIEEKAEILFWIDWHEEYMNTYKPK